MKKKKIVFGAGTALSIFVVAIMISSATAVPVLNKAGNELEINSEKNSIDTNIISTENNDVLNEKKESLFNLLVEILNNEELRKILKNDFNVKSLKYYTYENMEELYQEALEKYESIDMDEVKEKFNDCLTKGNDLFNSVSNFIEEDDEISASIKELSSYCEECSSNEYGTNEWFPGQGLICSYILLMLLAFWPAFSLGYFLLELTYYHLGWGLCAPWLITAVIFGSYSCEEIFGV